MKKRMAIAGMLLLLVLPCQAGEQELSFELHGRMHVILVEASVNGRPVTLILDTGATNTMLTQQAAGMSSLQLQLSRFANREPGIRGEAVWGEVTLRLGKHTWRDQRVAVMNLDELTRVYGRQIDGILGQDLLRKFSSVEIRFKSKKIILRD